MPRKGESMKFPGVRSNWEFVAWYLIQPSISETSRRFSRTQILRRDYEQVYNMLVILGHKKRPEHMEETIQKTLQNMRDKNWISFLGQGDYRLTDQGYAELLRNKENLDKIHAFTKEELKALRDLAQKI
jgi:hypothetical protein